MKGAADLYPLTPAQLGILFDALRDPDPELYFEQVRCDLVGDVGVDQLRMAWEATIAHHPALRTIWLWDGLDDPVQVVRETVDLPWTALDWQGRDDQREALDRLAHDDRLAGFDVSKPPVLRVTVVRLANDRVHLIWSFHHIMLDGWSASLVLDEVLDRCVGREVADARPFRDHLAWIAAQDTTAAAHHWRELLRGFDEPTRLAGDAGPGTGPFRLGRATADLDDAATRRLLSVARSHRVTTNTLVQAAWATVLSCQSGDADVVFGVTDSGRTPEIDGVEHIIGMFLATLPMRITFDAALPIAAWWRHIQHQQLDLTQYQYSSLAQIGHESSVPAGVALFDTAIVFENYPTSQAGDRPVEVVDHSVFEQPRFPLTLMIGTDDRLRVVAVFDRTRFGDGAVEMLLEQFLDVLERMIDAPDRPLGSLSVLTDADRHRILVEWNRTDAPLPESTVPAEIERRMSEQPDAVALVDGDRTWTYADLVGRAAELADRIGAVGVERGRAVGVILPRSAEAVAAMLAVMRHGAAYVPLEPSTPAARLDVLLEEADLALAITGGEHGSLVAGRGIPTIDVAERSTVSRGDCAAIDVAPDDTMFVVFTSGSTGRPKGVPGTHRAVLNRLAWQSEVYPFADDEIACQKTTLGFVDHVAELWGPLVAGRPVVIVPDEIVRDVDAFVAELARHRVRRIVMVPALLDVVLEAVPDLRVRLPDLDLWTLSGERLPRSLADRFHAAMPGARLLNVYGMSEAMADVTCSDGDRDGAGETVSIGRPIRNQRVYVLDQVGRAAPIGVPGQIWVSGVGVAAGYWRRADLTAERFLPNPYGTGVHGRFYATGDLGRWTPDGRLEYLGRADRQVKVRGIRVELGDVEAAVRRLDGVRDVVVVDRAVGPEPTRLVAYVVAENGVDLEGMRQRLTERVPEHLVPAAFHRIDAIPLLTSGKPDRHALPDPGPNVHPTDTGELDDALRKMISIWRDVIGVEHIGPDDDFFDVGGHSILGMRLLSRIRRDLHVNLPLAVLYTDPTPRSILARMGQDGDGSTPTTDFRHLVPITSGVDARHRLYCIHGAGGNILNFRDLARHLEPGWGVIGVQARGVDGVTEPHPTIDAMCDAYIAEILADHPSGPVFVAGFSGGGIVAIEIAARLARRGVEVGAVILLDTFHPSIRMRRRTVAEHARALLRHGPAYLVERREVRRQRRRYSRAAEEVRAMASEDGAVPHELRDAQLVSSFRSALEVHEMSRFDGPVWLYAATELLDVLIHAGPDRGWAGFTPQLVVEHVPGDHTDFILEPNVAEVAARLRGRLDDALSAPSLEEQS